MENNEDYFNSEQYYKDNYPEQYTRYDEDGNEVLPNEEGWEDAEEPMSEDEILDIMFDRDDPDFDDESTTYDSVFGDD
ncbi:hypothetical protein ACKUSY_05595 [Myroides odoratus]